MHLDAYGLKSGRRCDCALALVPPPGVVPEETEDDGHTFAAESAEPFAVQLACRGQGSDA